MRESVVSELHRKVCSRCSLRNNLEGNGSIWKVAFTERNKEHQKCIFLGFPGGAVVKNVPANAGDMGSSPGPGRSHMPRSN